MSTVNKFHPMYDNAQPKCASNFAPKKHKLNMKYGVYGALMLIILVPSLEGAVLAPISLIMLN